MKTYQIKELLKNDLLIIELPENGYYEEYRDGIEVRDFLTDEVLTLADYTLLGKPDEIKEDDAEELVNLHESGYYKDYINGNNFFTLPSKSLLSAIETVVGKDWNFNRSIILVKN